MTVHQTIQVETFAPAKSPLPWQLRLTAIAVVAFYFYSLCWATVPPDMPLFLFPWYEHILRHGPIGAFAEPFSNYTPPYLYLLATASLAHNVLSPLHIIKLLSVAGTVFLTIAVADLLKAIGADRKPAAFALVLPTAIINAALFGQCDALWAGACLLAVAAMVRGNTIASLVWCGVGIAFKAQAAFIAPFIIGALVGRRTPLWQWSIPPFVSAVLMVPAWLAGWPAADLALIYLRQAEHLDFVGNLSSPWIWGAVLAPNAAHSLYILGYAAAAVSALAVGVLAARSLGKPIAMLRIALLSAMALPFLLPMMHERFFFLADVLALTLALAARNRPAIAIAVGVQITSLTALMSYIYNWPAPALIGSFVGAVTLASIIGDAKRSIRR